jgi:hypothetical protein
MYLTVGFFGLWRGRRHGVGLLYAELPGGHVHVVSMSDCSRDHMVNGSRDMVNESADRIITHSSSVCALIRGIGGTSLFREEGQLIFPARHSPLDLHALVRMVAGSRPPRYYALMSRYMHTKPTTPF